MKLSVFRICFTVIVLMTVSFTSLAQFDNLDKYNVVWTSQSKNSSESMPCGGGDIGLNVWVENGEILFYMSRSGAFDENNVFPKLGRVRVRISPNPFENSDFTQELKLKDGYVEINSKKEKYTVKIKIWVDVFNPVIHFESESSKPVKLEATYESWRIKDLEWTNPAQTWASLGYRDAPIRATVFADSIQYDKDAVSFYHQNRPTGIFDATVKMQGLDSIKNNLWNPLSNLIFGGLMYGQNMKPAGKTSGKYADTYFEGWKLQSNRSSRKNEFKVLLHINEASTKDIWKEEIQKIKNLTDNNSPNEFERTKRWWENFWNRSYIFINPDNTNANEPVWQVGRNYQLFRYQLGCNAYGKYPTKFNGGLFTFDPSYVDQNLPFTPDHRNWGGGTFTAQNQRLVYFPMFKTGDFDMLPSQLDFYLRAQRNAELRTAFYWGHKGASFTEQLEQFGLPLATSYGWNRPANSAKGIEYNYWLEYLWDTQLEFCLMMLDLEKYSGENITKYLPFVESCLTFFDEHYQWEALQRGRQALDGDGKLILFPSSGAETYKMAYNSTSTIAGLKTVLKRLLELPANYLTEDQRKHWIEVSKRIPEIAFREKEGHKTISPAYTWARINNQEIPQLYPVFPFSMYGIGYPDLQTAIDTWKYGTDKPIQKNFISWHQDAIFCARLGLTEEASKITIQKMQDANRRFPTFWGPGHDWVPDHNWGGSGMIGLQEMLMQTVDSAIYLFPAWPKKWDVKFKLHAPYNTTVEGELKSGIISNIRVMPASREKDIHIMLK